MADNELRDKTRTVLEEVVSEDPALQSREDRGQLIDAALNDVVGLGPLEGLLADDSVTEIMVNRAEETFIEHAYEPFSADLMGRVQLTSNINALQLAFARCMKYELPNNTHDIHSVADSR